MEQNVVCCIEVQFEKNFKYKILYDRIASFHGYFFFSLLLTPSLLPWAEYGKRFKGAAHERELPLLLDSSKLSSIHDLGRQTNENRRETKSNKELRRHKDKMPVNVLIRRRKQICHTLRKKRQLLLTCQ